MKIYKSGEALQDAQLPQEELDAINVFAKTSLKAEEVYAFSVLLCDNEVDRDFERFAESTLEELRELFVGKTGLFDHQWSADAQAARIYRTELLTDPQRSNSLGEPYMYLKGHAYMLRLPEYAPLIAEIEGGIKKETSVGCAVAKRICSVCGEEIGSPACPHIPGERYDGKLCFAELTGAVDAYEWSFVAVPAQKNAGVCKALQGDVPGDTLKQFVSSPLGGKFAGEFARLEKEAALGCKYMDDLRRETLRLALVCDRELHALLSPSVGGMDEPTLLGLQENFRKRLRERFPIQTQLPGREETIRFRDESFLI